MKVYKWDSSNAIGSSLRGNLERCQEGTMKTVCKVVTRVDGRLMSAFCWAYSTAIEYEEGKWVRGVHGPIFAFKDKVSAWKFAYPGFTGEEVWLAEAEGVREAKWMLEVGLVYDEKLVEGFWKKFPVGRFNTTYVEYAVPGTVVCDRLRLVRPLWRKEVQGWVECTK